jgi:hypothetical protein
MDLLISTGCGNVIQGGADVWTNHFLELVYPIIKNNKEYKVLIDGRKPIGWDSSYFKDIDITFYHEDRERSLELLKSCQKIHFLHSHYYHREHLMDFKDKFGTVFIHAYPKDILVGSNNFFRSPISVQEYDEFLSSAERLVWIGINKNSSVYERFDPWNIPNFYEFQHNIPFVKRVNPTFGYTARIETRKNPHYLDGQRGFVLTNKKDWNIAKHSTHMDDSKLKIYEWNANNLEPFMKKTWSVSHSCHENEPFGYSIFQAVDWGKIPIVHTSWQPNLNYKYQANSRSGMLLKYYEISNDSADVVEHEFEKIKKFMKKFDNKTEWIGKISRLFLC